jgi:signal transduction histidine kinase
VWFGVRHLLDGVRDRFVDRAAQRGRPIRVVVPDGGGWLALADPVRIRQALSNLVENALRHGSGEIVVAARRVACRVLFEVSDAGPGFAPDIAQRAFERFSRGQRSRSGGGAGLGLAIVQTVAQAHRGRAELVEPADGAGTTVRLWLPQPGAPGLPLLRDEDRFDGFAEHGGEAEGQRQAGVVAAGLDGVDRLAGHPAPVGQVGLAPPPGGP